MYKQRQIFILDGRLAKGSEAQNQVAVNGITTILEINVKF